MKRSTKKTKLGNSLENTLIELHEDIFEGDDFKRHVSEVSRLKNIPEDVVEKVLKHYMTEIPKVIFKNKYIQKRINVFGYFNIEFIKINKKEKINT